MSGGRELDAVERERLVRIVLDELARFEDVGHCDGLEITTGYRQLRDLSPADRGAVARATRERIFRELAREGFEVRRS